MIRHGSLFTGGCAGFDLAAHVLGWQNIFHCEKHKKRRLAVSKRWPNSISYGDIKTVDFKPHRGKIDVLSGSDPCQPHSRAGLGKGQADDKYLWPEMFRAVCEIHPFAIVNENVDGTIANGVLDIKIDDLEKEGYACQAYCIPAEAVGALHQRDRVWLVAIDSNNNVQIRKTGDISSATSEEILQKRHQVQHIGEPVDLWAVAANTDPKRFQEQYNGSFASSFQEGLSRYFGFGPAPHGHISRDIIELWECLMGYPKGWTILIGTKGSQHVETPSSGKLHTKSSKQ